MPRPSVLHIEFAVLFIISLIAIVQAVAHYLPL